MMPSRCCHGFVLEEMSFEALRISFRGTLKKLRESPGILKHIHRESLRTLQFLVPLYAKDISPELLATMSENTQRAIARGECVWTCKYFNKETGVCGIYDSRPSMCKVFPENDHAGRVDGFNYLCHHCTSSYCKYHPTTTYVETETEKEDVCNLS